MSENTKIEWADHTFNPWTGCTKVSTAATGGGGCDHCYAESWSKRAGDKVGKWGPGAPRVRTTAGNWRQPLKWNDAHAEFFAQHGRRQRVFCASLADVFDNEVDPQWRRDLFRLISDTPNLDWLVLTKRIGNVIPMMRAIIDIRDPLPSNVWLGATIVNQAEADRDIPKLLATPAAKRFLSMEPLLGPVDLVLRQKNGDLQDALSGQWLRNVTPADLARGASIHMGDGPRLDWVIAGGESGPGARPSHPDWYRALRDQCAAAAVPFLFKQWGEWGPTWLESHSHLPTLAPLDPAGEKAIAGTTVISGYYEDGRAHQELLPVVKLGKKAAGRLLDGTEHNGFPS
ncbi:phage Gp37/Gp68 family protein [Polaromonas sp.]|uniref:phage Gp37/Gp68 family protein n=1 Tax=Polaromonas sp. TaxID=1869339 RepID=UPI003266700C